MFLVPARAGTALIERFVHGIENDRVLTHPEIVVRAPNGDVVRHVTIEPMGGREGAASAEQICEHAIASLGVQPIEMSGKR